MDIILDPRTYIVRERLREVNYVVAVASGKGGVGKTLISTLSALILHDIGYRVGLLDLDLNCPSCHVVLGTNTNLTLREEKGLVPPIVHGIEFMSIAFFSGERALPLRGSSISNVILELLSLIRWSKLHYLIVDLPPGTSDEVLDLIKYIDREKLHFLLVTTPSRLAIEAVKKLIKILIDSKVKIIGIIENMCHKVERNLVDELCEVFSVPLLTKLPYEPILDEYIGNVGLLLETTVAFKLRDMWNHLCKTSLTVQHRDL